MQRFRAVLEINGTEHSSVRTNEREAMQTSSMLVSAALAEYRDLQNNVKDAEEFTIRFIPVPETGA